MANGTLTEEEERLLMERMAAKAANPAVNIATDLSASYVPAKYTPTKYADPLDVFKALVPEYTQYTPHGGTWLGGTGPQIDEHGNVKVWRGETSKNLDAVSGVKFFGLDPAPSNWATISDPSQDIHPMITQHSGGFTKYGTITPEEAIRGYGYVSGHGTVPDMHEITFTPQEADKVKPGGPAVAKTIHTVPDYAAGHPSGKAKTDAIKALDLPLPGSGEKIPGTGVETSMLGKYGPALKGAGRFLGLAGYPMSAMAASDYWGAGKPVRAAMAAGSALPVVGMPLLAAEMLTNAVDDGILPEDMPVSPTRFGSNEPYTGMGSVGVGTMETPHPGQALGHTTLDPSTPGAYLPDFDVTGDAGGAVGGHPVMDTIEDWGDPTMLSAPAFDSVRPSESTLSVDSWSPNWDTMENMYAQTDFVPPVTDQDFIDEGTIPPGDTLDYSRFLDPRYGGPRPELDPNRWGTPQQQAADVQKHARLVYGNAQDVPTWRPSMGIGMIPGYLGALTEEAIVGAPQPITDALTAFHDNPYAADLGARFRGMLSDDPYAPQVQTVDDIQDNINNAIFQDMRNAGFTEEQALANPNVNYDRTQLEAMASLMQSGDSSLTEDFVSYRLAGSLPGYEHLPEIATQVDTFSSPLANPNITAQATIDDYDAVSMGKRASHPGQGGHVGGPTDPDITIPEMVARNEMAMRQDAMPTQSDLAGITQQNVVNAQMAQEAAGRQRQQQAAIDAQIAASVMAPRQDAMPAAPAGPTQAEIEAQVAAAEKAHRDQQASARQALRDFYGSRAYQQEGASAPAGLIDIATEVDSFANIAEQGGGYQGGYEGMGGFEGYR